MTEEEITTQADAISRDMIDFLHARADMLPRNVALAIPLGIAAALFIACAMNRQQAIDMLNMCFDDIERGGKFSLPLEGEQHPQLTGYRNVR